MKTTFCFLFCILAFIIEGCTPLTLRPADFSWPIENVLKVDNKGFVEEQTMDVVVRRNDSFYPVCLYSFERNDSLF